MKKIIISCSNGMYLIEVPWFRKIKCKKLPTQKIRGYHVDSIMTDEAVKI